MRSLNELPPLRSSNEFPNFIFKSVESTWTAHSFCEECGVLMNSPLWFLKLQSLFWVPTLWLQNVESARTLHWVFEKCGVHMNSPLCGVHLNCCLVFKNAEFKRTPHCGLKKCGIHINSPLYFYEMCSLLEPPTVFLKNAEFTRTPQCDIKKCGVHFNSSLCFWKMRSSHELPSLRSPLQLPSCFKKMRNLFQPPQRGVQADSAWTPQCSIQKCGVHFDSSLCFWKMRSSHELPPLHSPPELPSCFLKMQSSFQPPQRGNSSGLRRGGVRVNSAFFKKTVESSSRLVHVVKTEWELMRTPQRGSSSGLCRGEFVWTPHFSKTQWRVPNLTHCIST